MEETSVRRDCREREEQEKLLRDELVVLEGSLVRFLALGNHRVGPISNPNFVADILQNY